MPAIVADIAAGSREAAVASWSSATIAARYPSARDGSTEPAAGYFDVIADANTVVAERGALLGTERRRFVVMIAHIWWPTISTGLPTVRLIDAEQGVDGNFVLTRIEVDLEADTTTLELFG